MVLRVFVLAAIASIGLSLACSAARAEEPKQEPAKAAIEKAEKTVVPLPTTTHRGRLSTRDRWRGKPYLRSAANEEARGRAMDVALPPANSAFQGGTNLQGGLYVAGSEALRGQSLDKALPPANPAFVGGGAGLGGGLGF